jgi:SPP1 gp7 family putative phage head morphogenesis protein
MAVILNVNNIFKISSMASIKKKSSDKKGLLINTLVVRKLNRSVLDVGQWRLALRAADNDRRQKLYELYDDVLLDPVLSNAIDKRINAITNADLVFMTDEQINTEMDDLIDSPVMEDILTEIMNSKFWGKTVMELDFIDGLQAYNIPRQHIRPEKGIVTVNPGDELGYPYRGDDFFLEAGKDKDFGLLLKAAPYAIFKRGGISDWAQFCELFGIPTKVGKYSAQDEESRKALEEAFNDSGGTSWLITPKETEIELKESSTRGDGNLFNNFRKACNEEILISILGQTMTTTDGSSRAQSQTHKDVEEDVNKSDRRFVQRILNTELLPRLEKRGFPVKGGWFSFPDAAETIGQKDKIDIFDKFQNSLGLPIGEDFLYDYFGIPKPKAGEVRKPEPEPEPETVPDKKKKKEDKKQKLADVEASVWSKLKEGLESFFALAPAGVGAASISAGDLLTNLNLADLPAFDTDALARRVTDGTDYFDPEQFYYTSSVLVKAIKQGFAEKNFALGIEYGFTPDAYKTALEMNLFHFSAAKTLSEVQELNAAFRASTGWSDFLKRTREISGKFNETWLRAEFDTAYLTGESSATYYRLMAQKDVYPYWQYVTMDDEKVRQEHMKLHGLVLECTDKLWEKIYPPNGWRCRCRVKPLIKLPSGYKLESERARVEEFFNTDEWKRAKAQGWGVNRALTAEVFDANQMYIRKFPTKAASYLEKLTAEKWNLDSISKEMAKAKTEITPVKKTVAELWKAESKNGILDLNLYNDRKIELTQQQFVRLMGKDDSRSTLWQALKETMASPDEIWLNNDGSKSFDNFSLIKYYKGRAVSVNYRVEKGKLVIKSWGELSPAKAIRDKKRRGLLIKRHGND